MSKDSSSVSIDAFFVPERRARTDKAQQIVAQVRAELEVLETTQEVRQRRRRSDDRAKHERMVEAIVCEALHGHLNETTIGVAISLGKQRRSRYEPRPYAPMKELLTRLGPEGTGVLTVEWGSRPEKGKGRRTTFAASPRLIQLASGLSFADFGRRSGGEPIILRNTKSNVARHQSEELPDPFETLAETGAMLDELISYADDEVSAALRAEMHDINEALDNADLSLSGSLSGRIDVGDRWLRRMFNNGRRDFRHGGRLAGGFWMGLPSEVRGHVLTIDGEAVAELDYSAMMPRLLYAHLGKSFAPDVDPYAIDGIAPKYREGVKSLFAALLYGPLKKWPRGVAEKLPPHSSLEAVIGHIKAQHPAVAERFGTMVGFELLRTESDIIVAVMLACLAEGIVALPIHDAVLCPAPAAGRVEAIMLSIFLSRTGMQGAVKKETPSRARLPVD